MNPTKKGQIAKFHTPLEGENPEQLYLVFEVIEDVDRPRAHIKALNTGLSFPSINTVHLDDLDVVDVNTQDLIGHSVTINKPDDSQVHGRIIKINEQSVKLDLTIVANGIVTNLWLTIIDEQGTEHSGALIVN